MSSNIVSKRIPRLQPLLVAFGLGPSTSAPRNGEVRRVDPGVCVCARVCMCVGMCVCVYLHVGGYVGVCIYQCTSKMKV